MSQPSAYDERPQRDDTGGEIADLQTQLAAANRYIVHLYRNFSLCIDELDALKREHVHQEFQNRLLRSEVDDINTASTNLEDRMHDQYHESLELQMHNAEIKERNAWLEKEVLRLKGYKEEDKTEEEKETKPVPKTKEPAKPACSTNGTREEALAPATSTARSLDSKKPSFHRYSQSTASSRARLTSPSTTIKATSKRVNVGSERPISSDRASNLPSSRTGSSTPKVAKRAGFPVTIDNVSEYNVDATDTPDASTPSSSKKRILSPQFRHMGGCVVARSPEPEPAWVDLRHYPMKLEGVVEQDKITRDEVGEPKAAVKQEGEEVNSGVIKSPALI